MAAERSPGGITRLPEIWEILQRHAPRDEWISIDRLYDLVEEHADLKAGDFEAAAPGSNQQKWQRNVRNVLQHRKTPGKTRPAEVLWDPPTRAYLIPRADSGLPEAALGIEESFVPVEPMATTPDPFEGAALESLIDARERALRAIVARRGGKAFRTALLDAYAGRCAMTSTAAPPALEAAHIVPYRGPETNHVANGLLLRADVHTLFDLGLVAIQPFTLRIETAAELEDTEYAKLSQKMLRLPARADAQPSQRSLLYHYRSSRVVA